MNNASLVGRLVKDPELRFIAGSGNAVCNFTIAIDRELAKEKKEEMQAKGLPTADFIRCVIWGKGGEFVASNAVKGTLVSVQGSIQTSTYKTNTGETRYSTDVVGKCKVLEWKKDNQGQSSDYGIDSSEFQPIEDDLDIPF